MPNVDDPSASHVQPQIHVPVSREGGDITLNVKTVLLALALLAGGGIGGGGISLVTKGTESNATQEALEKLDDKITDMNTTLVQMRETLKNNHEQQTRTDAMLSDHESRLRAIEKRLR